MLVNSEDQDLAAGYVLGDLETAEQTEFELRLSQNPALQAEVSRLQTSLHQLPLALEPLTPPDGLGDRILAAFTATQTPASAAEPETVSLPESVAADRGHFDRGHLGDLGEISRSRRSGSGRPWLKLLGILVALATIALGLDNLRLRNQLAIATQSNSQANSQANTNPLISSLADILQQPKSRLVSLQNPEAGLSGTLLFTPGHWQEVVIAFGDLPPLPPDQVYRMWLELANGEVLPCGEFIPNAEGQVLIRLTPPQTPPKGVKATGIFVTADAAGAPLQPTGNRLLSSEL